MTGAARRPARWRLLALAATVYLLLLAASHLARRARPEPPLPAGMEAVELGAPDGGERTTRLVYRAWGAPGRPVVLLLHGSPGSSADFRGLGPLLAERHRVIAPDLPGFGASERRVPDYSIAAHAGYALALLDRLGIERAHLAGFSMGGGVALEMIRRQPRRARTLSLISAIGVQELELLGSYPLNRAVHAAQLAALWVLHEAVPHFGQLDALPFDVAYGRNFYDTDQRPLRGILERIELPVLIVHGERDPLVPAVAAREHHRIVPQSELVMLGGSHFMVFRRPERLAAPILEFLSRAERGLARRRGAAEPARRRAAAAPFDPAVVPAAGGITLLVLAALIALATLASEDLTCIATGLLVSQGRIGLLAGATACAAGILIGDLLIWAAGRWLGRPALARAPLKWMVSPRALARSSRWFARRGPAVIMASRFLPGTRVATYFAAGLLDTRFWRFLLYFALAVALWTPLLVGLSAWLGGRMLDWFGLFQRWALPGALGLALLIWVTLGLLRGLASWTGRRRLLGSLRRKLEWEFWPWWVLYLPVLPWVAWLGIRHRGLTVFTAANPGIEAGGFVGESKAAILAAIAPHWVAPFRKLSAADPPAARLAAARALLAAHELELPLVVKPDVGERGRGVTIARSERQLEEQLAALDEDALVQAYVPGPELGVFYVRHPDAEHGRIFSITEKRLPVVIGDGKRTVEQLVLADERAMRMAPTHLDRLAGELDRVPAVGEQVRLVEVGTHSLGAVFLDGARRRTPELERVVDEIALSCNGFYFGRFDLRAPSWEAFARGTGIRVLELNGVTSEATHIYDPANSLLDAYRVLFRQWALAFEIGAANRARGVRPAGAVELLGRFARNLRRAR